MSRVLVGAGLVSAGSIASHFGNFYAISTATVTSGGASSITFSSIPQTYTHLQIRALLRDSGSSNAFYSAGIQINSDTGSNYTYHGLYGNGSTASTSSGGASYTQAYVLNTAGSGTTSNVFESSIVDILDYTNTNKYTTLRSLSGADANGSGYAGLYSSVWLSTSAITSLTILPYAGFLQNCQISLYGVK
jgi:hypothetical protein